MLDTNRARQLANETHAGTEIGNMVLEMADEIDNLRELATAIAEGKIVIRRVTADEAGERVIGWYPEGNDNTLYATAMLAAEAAFVKMREATA